MHKVCHSRVRALVSGIKKKELLKVVINIEAEDSNLILATLKMDCLRAKITALKDTRCHSSESWDDKLCAKFDFWRRD